MAIGCRIVCKQESEDTRNSAYYEVGTGYGRGCLKLIRGFGNKREGQDGGRHRERLGG